MESFGKTNVIFAKPPDSFISRRFVMTYPNEQLPAGLRKMAPAHDAMSEAGCVWGTSWDLEVPSLILPRKDRGMLTLKRSNAHDIAGEECKALRENVGLMEITGFSRFEVSGPNAELAHRIMAWKFRDWDAQNWHRCFRLKGV